MSGCPTEIRIVYSYLETLYSQTQTAANALAQCGVLSRLDFSPNHEVTQAYDSYLNEWGEHRKTLQEGLNSTAAVFKGVLDAFHSAEGALVEALR